jgi:Putative adhesin
VRLSRAVPAVAFLLAAGPLRADSTRMLEAELTPSATGAFSFLNLAGTMTVVSAAGSIVRVRATVHAESDELAASVTVTKTTGKDGEPLLLFQYPVERFDRFRYPPRGPGPDHGALYAGRKVRISGTEGALVYADLVVEVPNGVKKGRLETRAGAIDAEKLDGDLRLETGSGAIRLSHSRGDLVADTGSGDVTARGVQGTFRCDTGSGQCLVEDFEGDLIVCDTGSGPVLVSRARVGTLSVDTGSGRVRLEGIEAEEVRADTGSGPVDVEAFGIRLRRVTADTGNGTVRVRLARDAGFDARASLGSGELLCSFEDAERIVKRREVVGCRRGDGRIAIKVDTGNGGLVIEPMK